MKTVLLIFIILTTACSVWIQHNSATKLQEYQTYAVISKSTQYDSVSIEPNSKVIGFAIGTQRIAMVFTLINCLLLTAYFISTLVKKKKI